MIQPQMLFLISWLCLLFYQGTEDREQPIKYHHIFSALGKAIQETDCVYISHLWGGCISWKQCRIFPSLYSQRRIKNKNPSHTATQNKQKKIVSNIETLSMMNMHVEELSWSLWKILPKNVSSEGLSSCCCQGLLGHIQQVPLSTGQSCLGSAGQSLAGSPANGTPADELGGRGLDAS